MAQVIKKRIVKTILWLILSLFLLLALIAGAVQIPYVQTKIVNYISQEFSELTGYDISIERLAINWFDVIDVRGVKVIDPEGNELIYAREIDINFNVKALINKENHNIDKATIDGASVYLTKIMGSDSTITLNINDLIRRIRAQAGSKTPQRQFITIDHITLANSSFSYNDQERDSIKGGFDYFHFTLDSINGKFNNFSSVADTLDFQVVSLTANETSTHLGIKQFSSWFRVSQSAMEFRGINLKAGNSTIKDTIIFRYNSTLDLSEFNTKVNIEAHFDETVLHSKDLALFAASLQGFDEYYRLSGDFKGKVSAFTMDNAFLTFGEGTGLRGKIRMTGLPDLDETFMNFNLTNSYIYIEDLKYYLKEATYNRLNPFERVSFNGEFLGFINDFVAKGNFHTEYGRITSDINLKLEEDINKSTYSGNISMYNFDLGGYTDNKEFDHVTVRGNINGSGFTLEDANFDLKGEIDEIGIHGYKYVNIKTDAHFAKEFFKGYLSVNDPNLKLTTKGSIDLRKGMNIYNITAELDTLFLKPLNLSKDEVFIRSDIDVNARGLKLDSVIGIGFLKNTFITYKDKELGIDSLKLISQKKTGLRQLLLETNLLDMKIEGDFDYTVIFTDIKQLFYEYKLNLQNDKEALFDYYSQKKTDNYTNYRLDYNIQVKDPNPIFDLIAPDLYISPGGIIAGNFTGGYTSIISLETQADSVFYKEDEFYNNEMMLNISKIADSASVLAMVYVASEQQVISGIETKDVMFEGIWNKNHIDFEFDIEQISYSNYVSLFGSIDFMPDETQLKLQPSEVRVLDKNWNLEKDNLISIKKNDIAVSNLRVYNGAQSVAFNGNLSNDPEAKLSLNIDSLKLENLNGILSKDISGTLHGYAEIQNFYTNLQIQSKTYIKELKIEEFLVGNIEGKNLWNNNIKKFEVDAFIRRKGEKILFVKGNYSPGSDEKLELKAVLDNTQLKIIEPFIESYFTRIGGTASGEFDITGTPRSPVIKGSGKIDDAHMFVNYLNTGFQLNGDFYFEDNKIGVTQMAITDSRNNPGTISGMVYHSGYKNFFIDLSGNLSNVLVLNTTSEDNSLFYGTGIASGTIQFVGPVNNMSIIARARTEKGTRIFIPIGGSESIEKEEYINFTSLKDSTENTEITEVGKIDLRGLKLDFDLNITPDAYCEIIFDIKAGDIIRGRGNGDIKLQIDTKGEFNMFGDYHIKEGGYNFTLYNLINKEFEILPNSKISWYGNPYEGILDINATYNQLASFLPLLISQETDKVYEEVLELKRKYPVRVFLGIDGPLLSPLVNFDILTRNLPRNIKVADRPDVDLEFEFLKFKNSIDEQELKRQVFSLIVLRRFSPLQSFNTGGSLTSSVSELLSNQLSYWITQVDENLQIDFDLDFDQFDQEAYNTFQLRLSYIFLDGRLRVTRDGGFTNQENKSDISSVAGDWTLEYLLTPDGKFRAKMYNRTNYNPINPTKENQNTITTGFSILHTQSFDELKELFKKKKIIDLSEDENEEEPEDEDTEPIIENNKEAIINDDETN